MITALRHELGDPTLPVLMGGLGEFLIHRGGEDHLGNFVHVNAALEQFAAEDAHSAFVSAVGLESNPDNLHFSAAALEEFGCRYFDAFQTLPDYQNTFSDTEPHAQSERTAMELL
jgi:hypothetical protein